MPGLANYFKSSWGQAFESIFNVLPGSDGPDTTRRYGGSTINLPRVIELSDTVGFPQKPFILTGGRQRAQTVVRMAPGALTDIAFDVPAGWNPQHLEGIFFDGCRVNVQSQSRGYKSVTNCHFDSTTSPAFTLGTGVVNMHFSSVQWNRCAGAVNITGNYTDEVTLDQTCQIIRGTDIGIKTVSSGLRLFGVRFENRGSAASLTKPDIAVEPDEVTGYAGGIVQILKCIFGNEVDGTSHGPANQRIRLGPETPVAGSIVAVLIDGCEFRGNGNGTSSLDPVNAIHLTKAIADCRITNNWFNKHSGDLVKDDSLSAHRRSKFTGNSIAVEHVGNVWTGGSFPAGVELIGSLT